MSDFEYGRWYQDSTKTKIWKMESYIESIGDYRIFVVSSFESWSSRNIPKNIAVINNDRPNIGVIQLQDGEVTIDADAPVPDDVIAMAMIPYIVNDIKKAVDRHLKKGNGNEQ